MRGEKREQGEKGEGTQQGTEGTGWRKETAEAFYYKLAGGEQPKSTGIRWCFESASF